MRRAKLRDDRDYDTTQLHLAGSGRVLSRDYSAHFFRWSFTRRLIRPTDHVLEVGCGVEKPLAKILRYGTGLKQGVESYTGVDLNPLKPDANARLTFHGEFNFVERWRELQRPGGYDVVLHLEVIEHMLPKHGLTLLRGCYELLRPGGTMVMSTPCYDGRRHAANHIHEYTVDELRKVTEKTGFEVVQRYGTFMDVRSIAKAPTADPKLTAAVRLVHGALSGYYENNALSCFFAPLFPDHARNNLWVCRRPV